MSMQGLKFCPECSNMLFPIEVPDEKKLAYQCKLPTCNYKQPVDFPNQETNCIYFQDLGKGKLEFLIDPELSLDKTLSRSHDKICEKCGCNESVYFQNPAPQGETEMSLLFICSGRLPDGTLCGNSWIQGPPKKEK